MKRLFIALGLLCTMTMPSFVDARVWEGSAERPSRRSVREAAREPVMRNPALLSIRDIPLDRTFTYSDEGVKIQYPSIWEQIELLEHNPPLTLVALFIAADAENDLTNENVNFVIENLEHEMTLEEYTELGLEMERMYFDDYDLHVSEDVTIAGAYRGHRAIFTARLDQGDVTFEQIWMLRGKKAHVWTFADDANTFEESVGTFERMVDTLIVR